MFGIKKGKLDVQVVFNQIQPVSFVVIVRIDPFEFGILVHNELLCLMCAVNISIIPKRTQSLIVIRMEMGQEMVESTSRKGLTEIEIIDHYVCMS